jgi:hypothetical protein
MGYYYDWVNRQWVSRNHAEPTPVQRQQRARRRTLLDDLITDIEHGRNGEAYLYAGLLARTLVTTDEELMREFGKQVVRITGEPGHRVKKMTGVA